VKFDVVVIGGGAAGLMCAIEAGKRGRRVVVLEHNQRPGNKILISGGGRCNFTNRSVTAANYITSGSPHFVKSALARFTPADFLALVEQHGIAYHERKHGQLFCDLSSRQILELLEREAAAARVTIQLNCRVTGLRKPLAFAIETSLGGFAADSVVVATGGLSFPKLGVSELGYQIAGRFGLKLIPRRPGLVPVTWNAEDATAFGELTGLAVEVAARSNSPRFRENVLFTHRGLSGPVILQVSNYGTEAIHLDLLPDDPGVSFLEANRREAKELKTVLGLRLPQRLAAAWCARFAPAAKPMAHHTTRELEAIAARLHNWEIWPADTEGYAKAEVTLGGVDTGELSSKTLEARRVPGLHFIGEAVDVTGWLGGYNFQWAWASGFAAGQVA
jgi:predicted Rossmann fold flavoprotein